jgi:hypothetical protein
MRIIRAVAAAVLACASSGLCFAQDLDEVNSLWKQTVAAVQRGDLSVRVTLDRFTASAAAYVRAHGKSWQIEYLVGSADCMFPDKRQVGAEFLQDILANNRTLNDAGQAELKRQLAACKDPAHAAPASGDTAALPELTEVSTHVQSVSTQTVGVSGNMKGGGGRYSWNQESAGAISPIAAAELAARLVPVGQPEIALEKALARLSPTARGAWEEGIAVANLSGSEQEAKLTGDCLKRYADPLKSEFQIESSQYIIIAYSVPNEQAVYEYAGKLHGLRLPIGVLAYSVPDDMSLVSTDSGERCGSMAHELVHLLIKNNFAGAPAWLEEGLASEVAIASPAPQKLRLEWSWRDDTLATREDLMPTVEQLLDMPWSALNAYEWSGARKAEANQAMTAVFIRYLDSKGKLPAVYFAVRDQHVNPDLQFKSYRQIVEENLGMPVSAIDVDFKRWFKSEGSTHLSLEAGSPRQGPRYPAANAAAPHDNCPQMSANAPPNATPCTPTKSVSPNAPAEPSTNAPANTAPPPTSPNAPPKPN